MTQKSIINIKESVNLLSSFMVMVITMLAIVTERKNSPKARDRKPQSVQESQNSEIYMKSSRFKQMIELKREPINMGHDSKRMLSHLKQQKQKQQPQLTLMPTHLYTLLTGALLGVVVQAQTLGASAGNCDSSRLLRCQQDILRDLQAASPLNSASNQYPISGPPYSPTKMVGSHSSCRLVRANLDCLLQTTPNCYDFDLPSVKNTDYILRGKRFLEENGCNEPIANWRSSLCYMSPQMRLCKEQYETALANANPWSSFGTYNYNQTCPFYMRFKNCVDQHLRLQCRVQDTDMMNEYLIDEAADHTWRCSNQYNTSSYQNYLLQYALNNSPTGSLLSPTGNYANSHHYNSQYEQRPHYVGSSSGSINSLRVGSDQTWEHFRNPSSVFDENRPGLGRYPGEIFDRLTNPIDFDPTDCYSRAGQFFRECEDKLLEEKRAARDAPVYEMERKNCCSLHHYRNCIARNVLDRCHEQAPKLAVDYFMGNHQREMFICRTVDTMLCSGALSNIIQMSPLVLVLSIVSCLISMKQQQQLSSTQIPKTIQL